MFVYLALRNLILQRKRYALMATAVLIGFVLVTVLTSLAQGAMETIQAKAARYFAGHVSITGHRQRVYGIGNPEAVLEALAGANVRIENASRRTVYHRQDSRLFFGGQSIRQRRLVGVEFENEFRELSALAFSEGGVDGMLGPEGENGVLISDVAARLLGARLGDDVSLFVTTDDGQLNTATLVVRGIFQETGIFGYVTYMRNADLNRLIGRPPAAATDVAVYIPGDASTQAAAEAVRSHLAREGFPVFPTRLRRDDDVVDRSVPVETLEVASLDAHLAEIQDLVDAFLMVSNFVIALFMFIVMFGILNTYRVLLHQRTREIGTMRALGMSRGGVKAVFLLEAAGLALVSSLVGFLFGAVIVSLAGMINLGSGPAVGMFTEYGQLRFSIHTRVVLQTLALMVGAVVVAAWSPARRASRLDPVEALRKET